MQKDFITVTPDSGNGNGTVTVTVAASQNPTTSQRSSFIEVSGGGITRRISVNQESGGTVISIKGASAIQGSPTLVRAKASDNVNTDVNVSLHWVYSLSSQSGDVVVTISSGENMSNLAQISDYPLPNTVVTVTGVSPAKSSTQIYSY